MSSRKRSGLAADLVGLPWQFSAALAVFACAGIRWILPELLPKTGPLAGLASSLLPLSWMALFGFGALSMLAALRARLQAKKTDASRPPGKRRERPVPTSGNARPAPEYSPAASNTPPAAWSLEALRTLEWKRFELLCARYYESVGFRTETLDAGPDGGIDVKLYKSDSGKPLAIVQCKAWNTQQVGVKEVRELLGVMAHTQVARGIFITTGAYTQDAMRFGEANPIQLLDGTAFCARMSELPHEKQETLLQFAFAGDFATPTCASCGAKMMPRESRRGSFWGCAHYPRCTSTLPMRALQQAERPCPRP